MQLDSLRKCFSELWFVDFEFVGRDADLPDRVVCMVAHEFWSGKKLYLWEDELKNHSSAPFGLDENSCLVAYSANAELSCFMKLGWEFPQYVIDLFPEFLNITNGRYLPQGTGLVGAMTYFGISGASAERKEQMRGMVLENRNYSESEKRDILKYCSEDVIAAEKLFKRIVQHRFFDWRFALNRGRYIKSVTKMFATGIPIKHDELHLILEAWEAIKLHLISKIDADYGVYEGTKFSFAKFGSYLKSHGLRWLHTDSGRLATDEETFRFMARIYPELEPLRELKGTVSKLKLNNLQLGQDFRNRFYLSPFGTLTSRNAPSQSKSIFGPSKWIRHLIAPREGYGLAYIDWKQQEFGIAAALSGDETMKEVYQAKDPYLELAYIAGEAPANATKETHKEVRNRFKQTVLGLQYLMGANTLATGLNIQKYEAEKLIAIHKEKFAKFWEWSDSVVRFAFMHGYIHTTFGWYFQITNKPSSSAKKKNNSNLFGPSESTIRNFPMQANGAEMMRLACCLAVERGVEVCAPVHDALLIQAPLEKLEAAIHETRNAMTEASRIVLNGFPLGTDVERILFPNRYTEERGEELWAIIFKLVLKEADKRTDLSSNESELSPPSI